MNEERLEPQEIRRLEQHASALYATPPWLTWLAAAFLVIGVASFVAGVRYAPGRAWASLLVNTLFWTGLSMACVVVAATFNVSYARWGRAVQRITAALGVFLPISLVPLVLLGLGRTYLFSWLSLPDRSPWLHTNALILRDILVVAICAGMAQWTLHHAMRPDVGMLVEEGVLQRRGFAAWLTRGWRGSDREQIRTMRILKTLSPALIMAYALGFSILSIDLEMTLDPAFRSTMFPGIYWLGEFYAAFAVATVLVALWRHVAPFAEIISSAQLLDLGNMLWGTCIFWGYVSWAQYFVIWMANLPNEAQWVIARWRTPPWSILAWTMLTCTFIVPFLALFSRRLKRNPAALGWIGALALVGILLQRFLDVFPSVATLGPSDYGLTEVGTTLGFLGAMALPYLWIMRRVPLFPIEDPLFVRSLETRGVEV